MSFHQRPDDRFRDQQLDNRNDRSFAPGNSDEQVSRIQYLLSDEVYRKFEHDQQQLNNLYKQDLMKSQQHDGVILHSVERELNELKRKNHEFENSNQEFLSYFKDAKDRLHECYNELSHQKDLNSDNLTQFFPVMYFINLILSAKGHQVLMRGQTLDQKIDRYRKRKEKEEQKIIEMNSPMREEQLDPSIYPEIQQLPFNRTDPKESSPSKSPNRPTAVFGQGRQQNLAIPENNSMTYSQEVSQSQLQSKHHNQNIQQTFGLQNQQSQGPSSVKQQPMTFAPKPSPQFQVQQPARKQQARSDFNYCDYNDDEDF